MTLDDLKQRLQKPYDRVRWLGILREIFYDISILAEPHTIHSHHGDIEFYLELGCVSLQDGKKLAIFEITLGDQIKIPRNRVALRNIVARHIDQETNHGVLVIFTSQKKDDFRLTFAAKESEFDESGIFIEKQTATKRYTYLLGPHETCTTAAQRLIQLAEKRDRAILTDIVDAFSVEKLNIEFFDKYKAHYTSFVDYLLSSNMPRDAFGISPVDDSKEREKSNKPIRDFAKRLLGRLVFLHFLQKKGWLGCPAGSEKWTDGDRDFVRNLFLACPDKDKFYSTRLVPLFFEALNRDDRAVSLFSITGTRVPYLNGGLFERERMPNSHEQLPVEMIDFPATMFGLLLEFLSQYNFTIDENDPDDREVGIDPEMLGHIFENLLEDNKDKGAYYTPKAIVQYMCQQSLIYYLERRLGRREAITNLVRFKDIGIASDKDNWIRKNARQIEELLDQIKICDPAIGSGAFPIGLLQEIYWIKLALDWTLDPADTKLKIIQNAIYGVDIDAGAVEIARLRFWLSIIVDEEEPRPLPNLDYKIMQGNSLLESFEGIPLDNLQQERAFKVQVFSKNGQGNMFPGPLLEYAESQDAARAKEIAVLIKRYFGETNPREKQELHRKIDRFVLDHIDYNLQLAEEGYSDQLKIIMADVKRKKEFDQQFKNPKKIQKQIAQLEVELKAIYRKKVLLKQLEEKPERPYFLWHLFFQDVFEQGGFDIMIANPPYVRQESIKDQKTHLEKAYGDFFCGTADLYTYFFKLGLDKLKAGGMLCFIAPNKFMRAGYGKNTRKLLITGARPRIVLDFGDLPIFDATTYPSIMLVEKDCEDDPPETFLAATFTESAQLKRLEDTVSAIGFNMPADALKAEGWMLERPDVLALMEKLKKAGTPLGEYVQGKFYYGIKTGFNEAFVIDEATRQQLINEDPKSADLINPWLRGRDIRKWKAQWAGLYLITIASSANREWPWSKEKSEVKARAVFAKKYPAVYRHLSQWEDKLKNRDDQGKFWWELRSCAYYSDFEKDKIVYQVFQVSPCFLLDTNGILTNNASYIIPNGDMYLLAYLNSTLGWFMIRQYCSPIQNGFQLMAAYFEKTIIYPSTDEQKLPIVERVKKIIADPYSHDIQLLESEIDSLIYTLYDLTQEEIDLVKNERSTSSIPKKKQLLTRILPAIKRQSAYFSLDAVRSAANQAKIELSEDTLREYMSEAMASGIVSDAGRGWYSRHDKPVNLDSSPIKKIVEDVRKAFPLLDFSCWSTTQFNSFALHLIAQPTIFLYAESDTLDSVAENLREAGWNAWANPGKNDIERFIRPGDKTVILRPSIIKQPESENNAAPIEKALVDLIIETPKLALMDRTEVQRIIDNVLGSGLIQLSVLFSYSEEKRVKIESRDIAH